MMRTRKEIEDEIKEVTELYGKAKVMNEGGKVQITGSYGKFGSAYSFLYSPKLMLTVTLTGQLYLLMLIEKLESKGFKVVSANTDGIEMLYKKDKDEKLRKIVGKWEKKTKMEMEYGEYLKLYSRDVNNYVAVYDGYVKAKGVYGEPELSKNSEYPIVFEAIREFLLSGKPYTSTILECTDIRQFLSSRAVTGGGIYSSTKYKDTDEFIKYQKDALEYYGGFGSGRAGINKALEKRNDEYHKLQLLESGDYSYLGKVVRWYYSTNGANIYYKKSGNKVPKTDGATPMMDLVDGIPKDLDYNKYFELCSKHIKELGIL